MPSCADPWSCTGPKVASPGPAGRGRRASGRPPRPSTRARRQERRNCRPALPCLQSRQAGAAVNRTRCHKLIWIRGDLYRPWSSACGTTSAGRCLTAGRAWAASPPALSESAAIRSREADRKPVLLALLLSSAGCSEQVAHGGSPAVIDVMRLGVAASLTESVIPSAVPRPGLVRVSDGNFARSPGAMRSSTTTSHSAGNAPAELR
jgi:hypothetical protein